MRATIFGNLTIDPRAAEPVYRQIADGIRGALTAGRVAPGERLPPTRDLAKALGVNRNTVVAAYDLLIETGEATGQTGRGTFLAGPRPRRRRRRASAIRGTARSRVPSRARESGACSRSTVWPRPTKGYLSPGATRRAT